MTRGVPRRLEVWPSVEPSLRNAVAMGRHQCALRVEGEVVIAVCLSYLCGPVRGEVVVERVGPTRCQAAPVHHKDVAGVPFIGETECVLPGRLGTVMDNVNELGAMRRVLPPRWNR